MKYTAVPVFEPGDQILVVGKWIYGIKEIEYGPRKCRILANKDVTMHLDVEDITSNSPKNNLNDVAFKGKRVFCRVADSKEMLATSEVIVRIKYIGTATYEDGIDQYQYVLDDCGRSWNHALPLTVDELIALY